MDQKKILIVDDQSFIREVFKHQLEQLGNIHTIEAVNGNEAIGKAKAAHPDLILLDIVMPDSDGFHVLEELGKDSDTQIIPIVVISSHADAEIQSRAKELGAREFIDKAQVNQIDFLGLITTYLGE